MDGRPAGTRWETFHTFGDAVTYYAASNDCATDGAACSTGTARHGRGVLQSEVGLLLRRDVTLRPLLIGEMPQVRGAADQRLACLSTTSMRRPYSSSSPAKATRPSARSGWNPSATSDCCDRWSCGPTRAAAVSAGNWSKRSSGMRARCGMDQLVLLTQTAEPFFATRGYAVIAREAAPAAVRRSAEFRSICPASAICMTRQLRAMP